MRIRYYDAVIYHPPHWRNKITFLTGPKLQKFFLLWLLMAACGVGLRAQIFDGFGTSHEYDWGWDPSVAISGSTVVEVHNGNVTGGPMWYHVGLVLPGNQILWGPSYQYDNGFNPKWPWSDRPWWRFIMEALIPTSCGITWVRYRYRIGQSTGGRVMRTIMETIHRWP
jgi:hypothetical protein